MVISLSVIIITKNEEKNIEYCIQSIIPLAKEIIVVDNNSIDKTVQTAKKFTIKLFKGSFNNFKEQREYGLKKATSEWILFLDADERVSQELVKEIIKTITNNPLDGYYIPFRHFFLGKWLKYGGWYPSYLPRLAKREKASITNPIHELLCIKGSTGYLKNDIIHLGDTSLFKRVEKTNKYTTMQVEQRYKQKISILVSVLQICTLPLLRFIKMYIVKRGFLDGMHGLIRAQLYMYTWVLVYSKEIEKNLKIIFLF